MRVTMKVLLTVLLMAPLAQVASARVYMCVDPQTGATSFTDKACARSTSGEEVRVDAANYESGRSTAPASNGPKVWNSHRDDRKTGRDYNDERRRRVIDKSSGGAAGG